MDVQCVKCVCYYGGSLYRGCVDIPFTVSNLGKTEEYHSSYRRLRYKGVSIGVPLLRLVYSIRLF